MIAADTSTWVAYLGGASGDDVLLLKKALQDRQLLMLPVVLTELLGDPKLPPAVAASLIDLPLIELEPGFWQRAGALRAKVLTKGRRARLSDALIAQFCLDHGVSLLTRDRDFRAFAEVSSLRLLLSP
jgi:predicted nucleic acid-binding protein